MNHYQIRTAAVIGSGTMGAALAAHLANAGLPVTLLDIVPDRLTPEEQRQGLTLADPQVRNRIARAGLERALKARPASFFSQERAALVKLGNLEDDLAAAAQADWVIEAIVEDLAIKRSLMQRLEAARGPLTIISTNTSGIPVGEIAAGRSPEFRRHFLGTHFFNPPRYLRLVEVIPIPETLQAVLQALEHFLEYRLGKGVVRAKDTPNFIANRLGFGGGAFALDYILEHGYTVEEVDAITGPALGRPKTATFRLIDLVGLDVWQHVSRNLQPLIPHDDLAQAYLRSERANELIRRMVEKGLLGNKSQQGFYKEQRQGDAGREFWSLDLNTLEYSPPTRPRFEALGKALQAATLGERLKLLLGAEDRAGQLARALTYQGLAYASLRIPEIADTPLPIDAAMRWGFNHEAGPFEAWDLLGVADTAAKMDAAGFPPAKWVAEMLATGHPTFYQYENDRPVGVYHPGQGQYQPLARPAGLLLLKEARLIARNPSAALHDLGEDVACLEFTSKMNVLEEDTFKLLAEALERVDHEFAGLVIGGEAENFSAGANLFMVVLAAQNGLWDSLEQAVRSMQELNLRMRYFHKPVVAAPAGLALGGGSEVMMHTARVVAHAELYAGLVEIGAGVIPAGGGTKEMLRRVLNPALRSENALALPFLQRLFEQIGLAKVSTSAEEARQLGLLGPADRVVMGRQHLLAQARQEVLHLAQGGYQPPLPEQIYAAGREALAALRVGIYMLKQGRSITEHEALIGEKLACVLTGGELSRPAWVDEQHILDLEREAFLSLCGTEKTQQRMWNLLQTGKVLRN